MPARPASEPLPTRDDVALLLDALGWVCADPARARRLLDVTGMSADHLRQAVDRPATLAAIGRFLADHEPDLVACANALNVGPGVIIAAANQLAQD